MGGRSATGRRSGLPGIKLRCERADIGTSQRYPLPASQEQLADATGMTPVHVNRMLRELREAGLARFERPHVIIDRWEELARFAEFDPAYLL